jgi:predicted XRE-type DNA-binding protein
MSTTENRHFGSSFDDFLEEEGILEETETLALKEVLALQIEDTMRKLGLNKVQMAERMKTSRAQLDRLLDSRNTSVTLHTLQRAAAVLGKRVRLDLVDAPKAH